MQISRVIDVFKRSSGPSRIRGAVCAMARRECPFLNRPDHPLARSRATAVGRFDPFDRRWANGRCRRNSANGSADPEVGSQPDLANLGRTVIDRSGTGGAPPTRRPDISRPPLANIFHPGPRVDSSLFFYFTVRGKAGGGGGGPVNSCWFPGFPPLFFFYFFGGFCGFLWLGGGKKFKIIMGGMGWGVSARGKEG